MKYYLKPHVTDEMLKAVGFVKDRHGDHYRNTKRGEINIYKWSREIDENVYDRYTYTGYKYANEYRHIVKKHIKDLIDLDYVEVRND